ncbi:hypothetical protein TEA_005847 [Camellia sinensis var. sinensis]|uniref:Uncharacterized protein n=1 Tax=Camellia sinensis var. sinensis TaxID=542762 RepID=A0A4S4EK00_CAMSN|nr:hypothetical protein TEA_005847 [Camellia sinensis var. sinensis]
MMEEHKLRYLQLLLNRKNESDADRYVTVIVSLEQEARRCYAEPISLCANEMIEMMVLDGCFIIELMRKFEMAYLRAMKHGHVPEACVLVSDTCRTRTRVRHAVDTCLTLSPACPPFFRIFQSRTRGWTREDTIQTRRWVDRRSPRTVGEEKEREPETETD